MKISHFNTFPYGGAAYAARRLHAGLRKEGIDSDFYYWKNERNHLGDEYHQANFDTRSKGKILEPVRHQFDRIRQRRIKQRYDKHIRHRDANMEVFSAATLLEATRLNLVQRSSDVVNLHWTAFMLDWPSFFDSLDEHTPIVWTMHDMNPMTGGCHYNSGCEKFQTGCGNCPQLIQPGPTDESAVSFQVKQRALKNKNLTVVAPSQWMLKQARKSQVFPKQTEFECIPYGFDLDVVKPTQKFIARRQLGVPDDQTILVGFGAEDINHHRKGFHLLLDSLKKITSNRKVECLVFGAGELPDADHQLKFHSVGFVDSIERQTLVYSAMDMFVLPSLEDNSPQTGLEAMACGIPVVAFATGGIPEYVRRYETGITVPLGNANRMAEAISWLADNPKARDKMSIMAREFMLANHGLNEQTDSYLQLYHRLLGTQRQEKQSEYWYGNSESAAA